MKNNKKTLRELRDQLQVNRDRLTELRELITKEDRDLTEAELRESNRLHLENREIQADLVLASEQYQRENPDAYTQAEKLLREAVQGNTRAEVHLMREAKLMMVEDLKAGSLIPLKLQDFLKPLEEGLILHQLGLPMPTGLSGDYIWPIYEAIEAQVAGEGVTLSDTKIPFSKLTASPQRIGVAVPITRESIIQSDGVLETLVRQQLPLALTRLINRIMLSREKVNSATTLAGPFVALNGSPVEFAGGVPTLKELNALKTKVLATGVDGENLCFVMTLAMKGELEVTPRDPGSGLMICENDKICGIPVFTSHFIGEGYVGLGDWRYQPLGLFGDISFIVDPYSQARKNAVDFVVNANYGTVTLRKEAFVLAKTTE